MSENLVGFILSGLVFTFIEYRISIQIPHPHTRRSISLSLSLSHSFAGFSLPCLSFQLHKNQRLTQLSALLKL